MTIHQIFLILSPIYYRTYQYMEIFQINYVIHFIYQELWWFTNFNFCRLWYFVDWIFLAVTWSKTFGFRCSTKHHSSRFLWGWSATSCTLMREGVGESFLSGTDTLLSTSLASWGSFWVWTPSSKWTVTKLSREEKLLLDKLTG